jgi:type I restriction-modification system DNA methylase subunit
VRQCSRARFDQYAESATGKHGTAEVDHAFLAEIERWRDLLAHNIALRNPSLSQRDLNYAVQMTIDRLIFLRICEDRGIEFYGQLQALLNGTETYSRLCQLYRNADDRYNSGLFHFRAEKGQADTPDTLSLGMALDDKPLKDILANLYYPESPYEFSVLPADILGQVYEQFLGKVIRLTSAHHAVVEDKPEVKKAGGVFYTPTFIVDYIVKHTLGDLLQNKHPGEVGLGRGAPIRVLDMACGSGSFLLGAYQFLLDWYLNAYAASEPEKYATGRSPQLVQVSHGEWRLTTSERKRILLDHIYGVDIDPQAVEVTKLSLLLKVLEGESQDTVGKQLSLFHQRALPDLGQNIKCGNSLIGPDFYSGQQSTFLDAEEQYRINAFYWQHEYAHVFASSGGFDIIIGNPPYIRIHNLVDYYPDEVKFIQRYYSTASFGKVDIFVVFVEKGFQLLNETGILSFILPNKFMQADYGVGLRRLISDKRALTSLVDFGNSQVFEGATTYTCLLFLSKFYQQGFKAKFNRTYLSAKNFLAEAPLEERNYISFGIFPWQSAPISDSGILLKLEGITTRLLDLVDLAITGVKTGANSIFIFDVLESNEKIAKLRREDTNEIVEIETKYLVPYLKAESLKRYHIGKGSRLLLYPYYLIDNRTQLVPVYDIENYPKTWHYLHNFKSELESRQKGKLKGPAWYGLSFSSSLQMFTVPKLVTPTLSPRNSFSYEQFGYFFPQGAGGGCGLVPNANCSPYYLLGLLNSRLLTFYFQRISSPFRSGWYAYEPRYLNRIPIYPINFSDPTDVQHYNQIISLGERMLSLHQQLSSAKTPNDKTYLQRQTESTDAQIDTLVYKLYGLTEEEILLVEGR